MSNQINDSDAIRQLEEIIAEQKKAFLKDQRPSIETRKERLTKVITMMMSHRQEVRDALKSDFGSHPDGASDMIETLGPVGRAQYALENIDEWVKDDHRAAEPQVFGDGKAFVRLQPKGVVGNIVPWNFPFDLSAGPLCEMLAAGNRIIMKPSEYTPACGKLLEKMISETFPRDLVAVVNGGVELSKAFSQQKWDHLLYTGSPAVAKSVMREAAANLVPLTLELGGKCPAILTPGSVNERNVSSILAIKMAKNGQVCITVDTVHVSRDDLQSFLDTAKALCTKSIPKYSSTDDCCGIISAKHMDRITGMIEEAKSGGAKVVQLEENGSVDKQTRRMPVSLIIDAPADSKVATEEIFGPLLAIRPYDDLDDVIEHVNAGERPLGLYVFGEEALTDRVLDNTNSGGASVNAAAIQGALPSMGFGGSGNSGYGRHHGKDGFLEFSNRRGVFVRGEKPDLLAAFGPPYSTALAMASYAWQTPADAAPAQPVAPAP